MSLSPKKVCRQIHPLFAAAETDSEPAEALSVEPAVGDKVVAAVESVAAEPDEIAGVFAAAGIVDVPAGALAADSVVGSPASASDRQNQIPRLR